MKPKQARVRQTAKPAAKTARTPRPPAAKSGAGGKAPFSQFPPILLEGDETPVAGGEATAILKYALTPAAPAQPQKAPEPEPPPAHGTGQLRLIPRDPHCLYASWDISPEEQRRYNTLSIHHHLVVRLHRDQPHGDVTAETHVHPESRHWFLHVPQAASTYVAVLGYYTPTMEWRVLAVADPATMPRETPVEEWAERFVTVPFDVPLPAALPGQFAPLPSWAGVTAPAPSRAAGAWPLPSPQIAWDAPPAPRPVRPAPDLESPPTPATVPVPLEWTRAQDYALNELLPTALTRREVVSSIQIEEMLRRAALKPAGFPRPAEGWQPVPGEVAEMAFSPFGGEGPAIFSQAAGPEQLPQPAFWFNVNAELIVYGATDPAALVTIAGQPVKLRRDGTFSYRFSLPDGTYTLLISADSRRGEVRHAELVFSRGSHFAGEVGAAPQDPALKPPAPEHLA